jgi:glycosyltransferase involved in cell wall biosynthesis
MRVLHVIDQASALEWFQLLTDNTDPERAELAFVTVGPEGRLQDGMANAGFEAFSLGAERRADLTRATVELARRLRKREFDVVHAHQLEGVLVGLTAARLARSGVRVMTAHHCHEMPLYGGRQLAVDRACVRHLAQRVIAPCRQLAATLITEHHADARSISVIEHGLKLERFQTASRENDRVRRDLGVEAGEILCLAISRFYWIKNLDALIGAFGKIAGTDSRLRLVIVGAGDKRPLQALISRLELEERAQLLDFRDDIPDLLAACDLFVHPSRAESFGQVLVEAMAAARPVLATPVGIAPEVIIDGENGFVIDGFDEKAIGSALRRAIAKRDRWQTIGLAAARASDRFPASTMAERYVVLYESLVSERRSA